MVLHIPLNELAVVTFVFALRVFLTEFTFVDIDAFVNDCKPVFDDLHHTSRIPAQEQVLYCVFVELPFVDTSLILLLFRHILVCLALTFV